MCITELLELQYLSLSWTYIQALPEELRKLVKLKFLDLSYMNVLKIIPSGVIGSLEELRVLNLYESRQVDWDFDEVYKLKHLNDLGITINTKHNNTLTKLLNNKELQMCTRYLCLEQFHEAELMNMGIEQQQQHHLGGSSCFQNLGGISIFNCNGLKDLTWAGYLPNLETLSVAICKELEDIVGIVVVDDFGGSTGGDEIISSSLKKKKKKNNKMIMNNVEDVFKRLKGLYLTFLPKLKSISRNALVFPCLERLSINNCLELKKLPFDSDSNLNNTLREIIGGPKWWSELQWEDEEEDHNNNNNNNNNDELLKSKFLPYFIEQMRFDESSDDE